jgi:hypothetical protein
MATEWEEMITGARYGASDLKPVAARRRARALMQAYDQTLGEGDERRAILVDLLGAVGEGPGSSRRSRATSAGISGFATASVSTSTVRSSTPPR